MRSPLEFLALRFYSEIEALFKDIEKGTYDDLAAEIYGLVEKIMRRLIADTFQIEIDDIEDARETYLDVCPPRDGGIERNGDEISATRDFTEIVSKILGRKINAMGGIVATPVKQVEVIAETAYTLHARVRIDGYFVPISYTIIKVPKYNGGIEVAAIPTDDIIIDE